MSGYNHTLNLVLAIAVTIFCCLPLGVVAIVFAAIGMSREGSGDYVGAESAARTARTLIWISFGLGVAILVLYAIFFLALGMGSVFYGF